MSSSISFNRNLPLTSSRVRQENCVFNSIYGHMWTAKPAQAVCRVSRLLVDARTPLPARADRLGCFPQNGEYDKRRKKTDNLGYRLTRYAMGKCLSRCCLRSETSDPQSSGHQHQLHAIGPVTQGPQPTSNSGVPSVVRVNFSGVDYKNWLKVGMSLLLTTKALTPFCKDEMVSFHISLKTSLGNRVCSVGCTTEVIKKKKKGFICTSNVCHRWLAAIKAQCATSQFSVANTTVCLWPVQPWQLAQYYMGPGQDAANTSPLKTDPGGILQLAINCKRFHPLIDIDKVEEVRQVRNMTMHNADYTVTTADMKKHLQCMTDLLQEPGLHAQPHTDSAANDAIDDIKQIESVDIDINDAAIIESERNIWKSLVADQTTNREVIETIIKSNENLKKRLSEVYTELKRYIDDAKPLIDTLPVTEIAQFAVTVKIANETFSKQLENRKSKEYKLLKSKVVAALENVMDKKLVKENYKITDVTFSKGSLVVDYVVKVQKSEAAVVDNVITAIAKSNGTFGEFNVDSVGKTEIVDTLLEKVRLLEDENEKMQEAMYQLQDDVRLLKDGKENVQGDKNRAWYKKLKGDPLNLETLLYEIQDADVVDVFPREISVSHKTVSPTEMRAVCWILRQEACPVTTLKLSDCGLNTGLVKQLSDGLRGNTSVKTLCLMNRLAAPLNYGDPSTPQYDKSHFTTDSDSDYSLVTPEYDNSHLTTDSNSYYNGVLDMNRMLSEEEAAKSLGYALASMTQLCRLDLAYCGLTDVGFTHIAACLVRGCQQLESLECQANCLTDNNEDTLRTLLTDLPQLEIMAVDNYLSDPVMDRLQTEFGTKRLLLFEGSSTLRLMCECEPGQ